MTRASSRDARAVVDAGVRAVRGLTLLVPLGTHAEAPVTHEGDRAPQRLGRGGQSLRRDASSLRRIAMRLAIVATSIAVTMKPSDIHVLMTGTCDVQKASEA